MKRAVSSSGAEKRIDGIKSTKEFVISDPTKIAIRHIVSIPRKGEREIRRKAIVFGCSPGINPAITPSRIPRSKKKKSSRNIIKIFCEYKYDKRNSEFWKT